MNEIDLNIDYNSMERLDFSDFKKRVIAAFFFSESEHGLFYPTEYFSKTKICKYCTFHDLNECKYIETLEKIDFLKAFNEYLMIINDICHENDSKLNYPEMYTIKNRLDDLINDLGSFYDLDFSIGLHTLSSFSNSAGKSNHSTTFVINSRNSSIFLPKDKGYTIEFHLNSETAALIEDNLKQFDAKQNQQIKIYYQDAVYNFKTTERPASTKDRKKVLWQLCKIMDEVLSARGIFLAQDKKILNLLKINNNNSSFFLNWIEFIQESIHHGSITRIQELNDREYEFYWQMFNYTLNAILNAK